jgi:AcrR family transcriptional regulator
LELRGIARETIGAAPIARPAPLRTNLRSCSFWSLVDQRRIARSRIVAAALEAAEDVGYGGMTVAEVISRARVSRRTFYEVFTGREDCFLAALEEALSQIGVLAREAYEREESWREGIRAGLAALLAFLDEEPALARVCLVEALGAGPRVLDRRAQLLEEMAEVVDRGRFVTSTVREPPEVAAEGVVGAVLAVLHTRALEARRQPFSALLGSLMNIIVLPYLGARTASRELSRPSPTARHREAPQLSRLWDPLAGMSMRLTYRTVRVLGVIGERPGACNREIAERSGVADPGQISKLLARLARQGMIENTCEAKQNGGANAWQLTQLGAHVEHATRPRADGLSSSPLRAPRRPVVASSA